MSDATDKTLGLIHRVSGKPRERITPEAHLVADLDMDSPRALELLMEIEEAFDVEIDDQDAGSFETVADVLHWVENLPAR